MRSVNRRHSVFGDYLVVSTKHPITDESKCAQAEIEDYNTLWKAYAKEISGKWGIDSIPTEKGFIAWLQNRISKEVK